MNIIVMFWSVFDKNLDTSLAKWLTRTAEITDLHLLALSSQVKFNNEIRIYSYQKINTHKISGINLLDASEIYPAHAAYKALCAGHSIAHVSDLVRMTVASEVNGIVIDMDAVVLRQYPDGSGAFFSSMPAKKTGGFAPKWGANKPALVIHDKSWDGKALSVFPVRFSSSSGSGSGVRSLINKIISSLDSPPDTSQDWNYVMWELKKIAAEDEKSITYPPIRFCPLAGWLGSGKCYSLETPTRLDGKTVIFGHLFYAASYILAESYVIQHFFESAFQDAPSKSHLWASLSSSSFLAQEAKYILGDYWRTELLNIKNR